MKPKPKKFILKGLIQTLIIRDKLSLYSSRQEGSLCFSGEEATISLKLGFRSRLIIFEHQNNQSPILNPQLGILNR